MDKELSVSSPSAVPGRAYQWAPPYTANDGNIAQHEIAPVDVRYPVAFDSASFRGDNQSTSRPKGSV
jgi:hypothetical protein